MTDPQPVPDSSSKAAPSRKCGCKCIPECNCNCPCACTEHCTCAKGKAEKCNGVCGKHQARNLVVSIDGTSNQFGKQNTNVVELHSRILTDPEDQQLTFYAPGIGTYVPPHSTWWKSFKQWSANKWDLAVAWNVERIIHEAHRWLADNYRHGDRIFLFGFSRGAYQVRTLAAMIKQVGLVHAGNIRSIPFAYEIYLQKHKGKDNRNSKEAEDMAKHFKKTFSRDVKVHFLGAWETVSSVGVVRQNIFPLANSASHICIFRHALALDERRVKFLPEYVEGGPSPDTTKVSSGDKMLNGVDQNNQEVTTEEGKREERGKGVKRKDDGAVRDVKEVWFAGAHCDTGGGVKENLKLTLSGTPLLWMANEAKPAGLRLSLDQTGGEWKWEALQMDAPTTSLKGRWWILEWLPIRRLTYKDNKATTTRRLHRGKGRKIVAGQLIHASVAFKSATYCPAASPNNRKLPKWKTLVGKDLKDIENNSWDGRWQKHLEMDLFDDSIVEVERVLQDLRDAENVSSPLSPLKRLSFIALSARGAKTIVDKNVIGDLIEFLSKNTSDLEEVRKASITCLRRLINHKQLHHILRTKVIQCTLHSPSCDDSDFAHIVDAVCTGDWFFYMPARKDMFQSDTVTRLVRIFSSHGDLSVQTHASEALAALALHDEFFQSIRETEALTTLSRDISFELSSDNLQEKTLLLEQNLYFLQNLAKHLEQKPAIDSVRVADAVFKFLQVDGFVGTATDVLVTIISHNYLCIADTAKMVATLIKIYKKHHGWEVHQNVQKIFAQYASRADTCQLLTTKEVLKTLQQALKDGDSDVRGAGSSFFEKLFESVGTARMLVETHDGLQTLRHALTSDDEDACAAGVSVFQKLFEMSDMRALVARKDVLQDVLQAVSKALRSDQYEAAWSSFLKLLEDASFRQPICAGSFIQDQVTTCDPNSYWVTQLGGQRVLAALAEKSDFVPCLLKAGAVPKALASDNDYVQVAGCTLLQRLAPSGEARKLILEYDLVKRLVAIRDGYDWHPGKQKKIRDASSATLKALLICDDVKRWLENQDEPLRTRVYASVLENAETRTAPDAVEVMENSDPVNPVVSDGRTSSPPSEGSPPADIQTSSD